jgi:hypothetical protein
VTGPAAPYKTWRPIEQATMSYGYGLSASLFQIAPAYTVFARDGELIPVSLLKQPQPAAGGMPRDLAEDGAVDARDAAHGRRPGRHRAAGAGDRLLGGRQERHRVQAGGKGYADKKYRAWFVGMAPISNPRIIVAVMVDEPTPASTSAATSPRRCSATSCSRRCARSTCRPTSRCAADRRARHPGRRGELLMLRELHSVPERSPGWRAAWRRARPPTAAGRAGDAFIAWPGSTTDGRSSSARARRRRAACLVEARACRPSLSDDDASRAMRGLKAATGRSRAASRRAERRLDVVATTGTNGKTSTAWWTAQALTRSAGAAASIGTLGIGEPPLGDDPARSPSTGSPRPTR